MAATEGISPAKSSPVAQGDSAGSSGSTGSAGSGSSGSTPGVNRPANFTGRVIQQFKLLEEIGEGPTGRVFVADDTRQHRRVALKLMPAKSRDGRPNARTMRLLAEAQKTAAALEHPHIVQVYETGSTAAIHYIAMELVEGGNLERMVQQAGPMEIERACQLVAEAAAALGFAHHRGIVHRDLKPTNLLMTRSGRCKVGDFGFAMVELGDGGDGGGGGAGAGAASKIRCVGTPYYVAPEVAAGQPATAASDIYSLGCTLFFLLTGRPPFPGAGARQVLRMHAIDPLPDVRQWRADLPQRLSDAIAQACAKQPNQRYASAEQFAAVLRTFTIPTPAGSSASRSTATPIDPLHAHDPIGNTPFVGVSSAPPTIGAAESTPYFDTEPAGRNPQGRKSWMVWAGAAAVAAVVIAGIAVWLMRPAPKAAQASPPPPPPPPQLQTAPPVKPSVAAPMPAAAPVATPARATETATTATPAGIDSAAGNMEEPDGKGGARGWHTQARYQPQVTLMEEGGNHFLRVNNPDAGKLVYFDRKIELDPAWVAVTVSARMRSTGFTSGKGSKQDGRVDVIFRDEHGTRVGGYPTVPCVRGDSPWTVRSATADVPPGAKSLLLQVGIFNSSGTVDFDDITVTPQK